MRLLLILFLFGKSVAGFTQEQPVTVYGNYIEGDYVKGNKVTIYKSIYYLADNEPDRKLLFLAIGIANKGINDSRSKEIVLKSKKLLDLCARSTTSKLYKTNKDSISIILNSIFESSNNKLNEEVATYEIKRFVAIHDSIYSANILQLKKSESIEGYSDLYDYFIEENKNYDFNRDTVKQKHFNKLVDASVLRLKQTKVASESEKVFTLLNTLYKGTDNRQYLLVETDKMLKESCSLIRRQLGELLLEGYKEYLIRNKRFKRKPTLQDSYEIYQFLISISGKSGLLSNMKSAQIYLAEKQFLICNDESIQEYNWSSNEKILNKIPLITLNKTLNDLIETSQLKEKVLNFNDNLYMRYEIDIRSFNLKVNWLIKLKNDNPIPNNGIKLFIDSDIYNSMAPMSSCHLFYPFSDYIFYSKFGK